MNAKIRITLAIVIITVLPRLVLRAEPAPVVVEAFVGETKIVRADGVDGVAIGNPEVADVQILSERPDDILINARKAGVTSLYIWKKGENAPKLFEIRVSNESSELEQRVYPLKHYMLTVTNYDDRLSQIKIEADEANIANLRSILTPLIGEKHYSVDITRNRVIMRGAKNDLDAAEAMLNEIDMPLRQVMIEAKVIEITKDDLNRLGQMLLAQKGDGGMQSSLGGDAASFNVAFDTFTDLAKRFSITVDALRTANVGRTLVNPKIAVLDGKTAWILAGEKLPVATRDSEHGLVSYNYINTGIILAVTPRVGHDRSITLWLKPEVSNVSGWVGDPESTSESAAPIIDTREVLSEVRVNDGETVLIGGLQRDETMESRSRVPVLSEIPLLGKLFRKKRTTTMTSELVIVITPRILDEHETPDLNKYGLVTMTAPSDALDVFVEEKH